jgi:AraC family transcriptional regulator
MIASKSSITPVGTGTQHGQKSESATTFEHFEEIRPQADFKSSLWRFIYPTVQISPAESIKRFGTERAVWFVETMYAPIGRKIECHFQGPVHLLVMYNEGTRRDGGTSIEGFAPSRIRNFVKKLTFVPAGHRYREQFETAAATRITFLYLAPAVIRTDLEADFAPRIHFEDAIVWETAAKLKNTIENGQAKQTPYLGALSSVLALELSRPDRNAVSHTSPNRGGLASWQRRVVINHIEQHLGKQICLTTLAQLARLSEHHFCRSFKQSFGAPPHLYHMRRRIEQAKLLLADRAISITDIGLTLGYSQSSSFSAAFRKITGWTPSEYRRELQ